MLYVVYCLGEKQRCFFEIAVLRYTTFRRRSFNGASSAYVKALHRCIYLVSLSTIIDSTVVLTVKFIKKNCKY